MLFDKYTKIILTVIALALVSISLQVTKSGSISSANANIMGDHMHFKSDIIKFVDHEH